MKISQKLILFFLLNALVPLIIAEGFSYYNTQRALDEQIKIQINNSANRQAGKIKDALKLDLHYMNLFPTGVELAIALNTYNTNPTQENQKLVNQALIQSFKFNSQFRRIHILSMDGSVIASTDHTFVNRSYKESEVFRTSKKELNESLFFYDSDKKLAHYLIKPVEYGQKTIGYGLLEAPIERYLFIVNDYSDLGKTGETLLLRRLNNKQYAYLTPPRFNTKIALTPYTSNQQHPNQDYRNADVLRVRRDIPDIPWIIEVKMDLAEIYHPAITLRNTAILIIIFTSIAVIFLGVYFARRITNPIQNFTEVVKRIQSGDLKLRVNVTSNTDEIGILGNAFNAMTNDLQTKIQQLHEEQIKLQASINSLSLGFIMVDRDTNIISMNQAAKSNFCASQNSPFTLVTDCTFAHIEATLKEAINLRAFINQCVAEKKPIIIKELKFKDKYFKILITPIITIGVIGAVILIDDITEEKIIARSKDEFFSIASHELRTPLTAIRGNISMIQDFYGDKIKDPKELSDMIQDVHDSSIRLIGIVNDFLDSSSLEMKKMIFKHETFDIVTFTQDIIQEYGATGTLQHLFLKMQLPPTPLPAVDADKDKMKQVLINLIGNSLKFTKIGGITISFVAQGNFVKIFVTDTGHGIAPENQHLLFRKFQQAGDSLFTRDTAKGTGLGLYISKLLIEGMHGEIKLESSIIEKGTTLSIIIPIATSQVQPPIHNT